MPGIYGNFSNGHGLVDFYFLKLEKMMLLCEKDFIAFSIMNSFIISLINRCVKENSVYDWIFVDFWEMQEKLPYLTEKIWKRALKNLEKSDLIISKKVRGKEIYEIQLL